MSTQENKPLISVVIPMYNASSTIIRCIDSVLCQQLTTSIEIIVVNDGSSDNCGKIVQDYSVKKNAPLVYVCKPNGGVSSARNAGMRKAKGNYIAFLDADDAWHTDKLSKQLAILQQYPDIGMIGANSISEKAKKWIGVHKEYIFDVPLSTLMYKNYFQPSTVIIRKEVRDTIGYFDEEQRYAEEGNFFMRVAHKFRCVILNEKLIDYGIADTVGFTSSGLSGNLVEMQKGERKNLKFAYKSGYINVFQYKFLETLSVMKYVRRILLVKLRKK